jgi:hypothetical protein
VRWADEESLAVLRRVLAEQFETSAEGSFKARADRDACGDVLVSPHETEARYGHKSQTDWQGYKLQISESIDAAGGFITDVAVSSTLETDQQALAAIQQRLNAHDLSPAQQYVDKGYVSAANIVASTQQAIDLRGRVADDTSAHPAGFQQADFQLDFARRQATCPAGQTSTSWRAYPRPRNNVNAEVSFGRQCRDCPFFRADGCTTNPRGRRLYLNPHLQVLLARRQEARSDAFRLEMRQRQGIEATLSECVRGHGARRARYRGLLKTTLQMSFMAAAVNLKRLVRRLTRQLKPIPDAFAFCRA